MTTEDIIDCLAARRAELGLSQRALAERMGYGHQTLQSWEIGYRRPNLVALCDWCEALGVTLEVRI